MNVSQPTIHEVASAEAINTSIGYFKTIIVDPAGASTPKDVLITSPGSWVDVRDVATAHAVSLSNPNAGGERFITSGGGFTWQGISESHYFPVIGWRFTENNHLVVQWMQSTCRHLLCLISTRGFPARRQRSRFIRAEPRRLKFWVFSTTISGPLR